MQDLLCNFCETLSASSCADVIDLSSGEDDAIVHVSSESAIEEEESEPSGAHANDVLNRPDTQGRVLVNVNHPSTEKDIFLSPQLARAVKPHQVLLLLLLQAKTNAWSLLSGCLVQISF